MIQKKLLAALLISWLAFLSCTKNDDLPNEVLVEPSNTREITVELRDLFLESPFNISLNSLLQASNDVLYVTSAATPYQDALVIGYELDATQTHPTPVVGYGDGPFEARVISASNKTTGNDTIVFLSLSSAKLLFINNHQEKSEWIVNPDLFADLGDVVAYNNGQVVFSLAPNSRRGKLIGVYSLEKGTISYGIPLRVPYQMQPAIRNRIFSITPTPDGFALAFVGDRKVYIIDNQARVKDRIYFGESDPIGTPFTISNPFDAPGSRPYIPKMEYQDGVLHVLVDGVLHLLDVQTMEVLSMLKFESIDNENIVPLEFTVNEQHLFVRVGRNDIYRVNLQSEWY